MSVARTWMTKNKSDRLHNTGFHLKGQYNVTFFCTKGLSIQTKSAWQPLLPSAKGLSFTFMKRVKVFPLFLLFFLFWQASCGEERSRHICPVGWHELLLLTSPLR